MAMTAPLHALLRQLVDYAGLFPPAALNLTEAVGNFAAYRAAPEAWILGRFVLPASQLDRFAIAAADSLPGDRQAWKLSALLGDDAVAGLAAVQEFNRYASGAVVDTVEGRADSPDRVASLAAGLADGLTLYVELPADAERSLIAAVGGGGGRAKIRTGGVTASAFPSADELVYFMSSCVEQRVAWKATAGLHHALSGTYPLTYEPDAPHGQMFGFLNLLIAAALLYSGHDPDLARDALLEADPGAFRFSGRDGSWREHSVPTSLLAAMRTRSAIAIGSCSFSEPVAELQALGLLDTQTR